jgi:two-component system response regulator FimZ (fimbrial Z protein)
VAWITQIVPRLGTSPEQDGVTANRRILVIDDSPLVVEAISDGLEDDKVDVEGVIDLAAIDQSQGFDRFDLILIDVQMPAMFGDDVAMVIRQGRSVARPIVLLSSLPEEELAERARDAGADGYISKRRGVDSVLAEVRAWLDGTKKET